MLVIRLFRTGKKNQPFFKIVVTDKRKPPRGGRFVEQVGFLNPLTKEKSLKAERIKHWISKGAKLSDTVHNLLVKEKIIEGKKTAVHKKSKKKEEAKPKEVKIEEAEKEETKPEEKKPEEVKKEVKIEGEKIKDSEVKKSEEVKEETKEETKEDKSDKSEKESSEK